MPDLISYCERNSFFPRREDTEAILRRLDHDANRQISYAEFNELVSGLGAPVSDAPAQEQPAEPQPEVAVSDAEAADKGDKDFNDRIEEVDEANELRAPKDGSAEKNNSAQRRKRDPTNDNLTPA